MLRLSSRIAFNISLPEGLLEGLSKALFLTLLLLLVSPPRRRGMALVILLRSAMMGPIASLGVRGRPSVATWRRPLIVPSSVGGQRDLESNIEGWLILAVQMKKCISTVLIYNCVILPGPDAAIDLPPPLAEAAAAVVKVARKDAESDYADDDDHLGDAGGREGDPAGCGERHPWASQLKTQVDFTLHGN
jgi:hypothetical protein